MRKLVVGYVVLCIVAIGGAVLVLSATGGFSGSGIGVYGKVALALAPVVIVVVGLVVLVLAWSRSRHPQ
jgi:hypothetical protein